MHNPKSRKRLFVIPALAVLTALSVLAGCGGDDDVEEAMMPEPMGYRVTVTNNLPDELFAPIVVTHAHNDRLLFDGANYVTREAQTQILTGNPEEVLARIGDGAVRGHGTLPTPDGHNVLLGPEESVDIMFDGDASALRILAMVAPTLYDDHYVSAVADVADLMPGQFVLVPLSRFDIGYDEMEMDIRLVGENAGTVTIERVGNAVVDDGGMMDAVTYAVEVMNHLSESGEFFAPIVVTRVNDEHYLFDGTYVTEAAEHQILFGPPSRVIDAIAEGDAVSFRGDGGPPGVLLPAGEAASDLFDTDATALRIIAMVAPTLVPDNYVSAVVNVTGLRVPGDYVAAPLTRFDIGHDEAASDHDGAMPAHGEMMTHRHREMTSMDITQVDDDATAGTVKITRQ